MVTARVVVAAVETGVAVDRTGTIITVSNVTLHSALPAMGIGASGCSPMLCIAELDC